jgi:Domain of unknown function (DUF4112)
MQARLDRLRRWSVLLDSAFTVPGTRIHFGWDPVAGLLPGFGDLLTPLYSLLIIGTAVQLGVPRVVQVRMALNVVVDALIGAVPLAGDLFDVAWKANLWNMQLLEHHAWTQRSASAGDWLFVSGIAAIVMVAVLIPVTAVALLAYGVGRLLI